MATKPTGLKIKRDKNKFSASWTNKSSNKKSVSKIIYKYRVKKKKGKWGKWSKDHKINKASKVNNFYSANLDKALLAVEFAVKTYTDAWSGFATKKFTLDKPKKPSASVTETTYPSATFSWSVTVSNKDSYVYRRMKYKTLLEQNAGESPGRGWPKKFSEYGKGADADPASKSFPVVEETSTIANKKYTRWYQFQAVGPAGTTDSSIVGIRYALPNEPSVDSKSISVGKDKSSFHVTFSYSIPRSYSVPISSIMPQYYIGTPASVDTEINPPATGWTDTVTTAPPSGASNVDGKASFYTSGVVGDNQCLWVRVVSKNSDKQNQQVPSDPCLAYLGTLSKPTNVDVEPIDPTSLRTTVKAKNNTGVPESFIAIYHVVGEENKEEVCVGVIPNGESKTVVQFSKYEETPDIRLYTIVGSAVPSSKFKETTDTQVDDTKLYFRQVIDSYKEVVTDGTENPSDKWWYEKSGDNYIPTDDETVEKLLSTDIEVDDFKNYYTYAQGEYIPVDPEGDENPSQEGWYEDKVYYEPDNLYYVVQLNPSGNPKSSHWYEVDGESLYSITNLWSSEAVNTSPTIKTPQNIVAEPSVASGSVRVNWDWPWKNADVAELSWSKNPEAWESTQEPSKYEISKAKPSSWVISDLENGESWYIRVRLGVSDADGTNYGPYGNAKPWPLPLTSNPATPLISVSKNTITEDGETTVSWYYSSADGTQQKSATLYEVVEENGSKAYNELTTVGSEQYVNINAKDEKYSWSVGEEHTLAVNVQSSAGMVSGYSNEVTVRVAEKAKCKIVDASFVDGVLTEMPITFSGIEEYVLTEDLVPEEGKQYYSRSDIAEHDYTEIGDIPPDRYQEIDDPVGNPAEQGWYEYSNDEYVLTQDTEVIEGKTYYTKFSENPKENGWYELEDEIYILTSDTSMVSEKDYYIQSGDPEYSYSLVIDPSSPKDNGYFERKPLDDDSITTAVIKRAEDFSQSRPDDSEFDGFNGETIYSGNPDENGTFTVNVSDLVGSLDDRAYYILELNTQDNLGQPAKDEIPFTVSWTHQAWYPEARVEIDQNETVAFLYPVAPKSSIQYIRTEDEEIYEDKKYYEASAVLDPVVEEIDTYFEFVNSAYVYTKDTSIDSGKTYYVVSQVENPVIEEIENYYEYSTIDVCDIYRLSVDKPELIYEGAIFGETYVDPYPTIGEYGGHRFVCRTPNGDYITDEDEIAWLDTGEEDGDRFETHSNIIDFDGERVFLLYEVDLSSSWSKDFQETRYLGGSIQGDWNPGVSRTGSMNVTTVSDYDQETIRLMHKLANYPGVCHVRTKDGASFSADVQVNETYEYTRAPRFNKYDLSITRVDAETLDAMTLDDWLKTQEVSE